MTGIIFYKLMTRLSSQYLQPSAFPRIDSLLSNDEFSTIDKNKLPLASIKHSLDFNHKLKANGESIQTCLPIRESNFNLLELEPSTF